MSEKTRLPLYHPRYALERAQELPNTIPLRLFAILLPLWHVEISASEEQQAEYELIERYLERGIAEGALRTTDALATFFGLDWQLVEKVLGFLESSDHVHKVQGAWNLTERGLRSLRDQTRYYPKESRQVLYFEAFGATPLPRGYYDKLSIVSEEDAEQVTQIYRGYRFQRLYSSHAWSSEALASLERRRDRAQYNLRENLGNLRTEAMMQVYLPLYVIQAQCGHALTYLAFFEQVVNGWPEIHNALADEEAPDEQKLWTRWLREQGLEDLRPARSASGGWQVNIPASAFRGGNDRLSPAKIGTYQLDGGYFLRIWCEDAETRRIAVLDRVLDLMQRRATSLKTFDAEEQLRRLSGELKTAVPTRAALRKRAESKGLHKLVAALEDD